MTTGNVTNIPPQNTMQQKHANGNHARHTPMMMQYLEIKSVNAGYLLFYRMGDFYELFLEDAEIASRALGIALTKRGKHQGQDIPMCGVPVHSAEQYLNKLIRLGHKVAVCEQTEDPAQARKRGYKAVVRRDVVRLVTPGTLTEETLLDAKCNNYMLAVKPLNIPDHYAVAWLDISTGEFNAGNTQNGSLEAEIARIAPKEILISENLRTLDPMIRNVAENTTITYLPDIHFDSATGERLLRDFFHVATLDSFGTFTRAEIGVCASIISYVQMTQIGHVPAIEPPRKQTGAEIMHIDAPTRANLELTQTLSGKNDHSLLAVIDKTVTGAGGRMLRAWLNSPLTDKKRIQRRLDGIEFFVENKEIRQQIRDILKKSPELARSFSRLHLQRGGPRDLAAIRDATQSMMTIRSYLKRNISDDEKDKTDILKHDFLTQSEEETALVDFLNQILADELPAHIRDGNFVRPNYDEKLDEFRNLRDQSRKVIISMQTEYAEKTHIKSLKIRHNNMLGYFVEASAQYGKKLTQPPFNEEFIHRQTLANAMRFSTTELAQLESKIVTAAEQALQAEIAIFEACLEQIKSHEKMLKRNADAMAMIDVITALAQLATTERYTRPTIDQSLIFDIKGGRHPVVEKAMAKASKDSFIANDCTLNVEAANNARIWLLTGPNMAGKSTFLRQNAIIAVMAQMGSFVPAQTAHIGMIDRLFSRVGAADDLARGRSTFMVEMIETAAILRQAGERSFVILDEIGRGTATFDGLSIAWATVESLHETNRCRTLFATHYHELTTLTDTLPKLANTTMKVREWEGNVIFLYEMTAGVANRSYGIQVAKLAGLPENIIKRAQAILATLEETEHRRITKELNQLPLFTQENKIVNHQKSHNSQTLEMVDTLLPDELTPRAALEFLYALKEKRLEEKEK